MDKPTNSLPLRLNNLYSKAPSLSKVAGTIDSTHHDYFVRHVLAGEHGSVQAILSHFWFKFYDHCINVEKIAPCWNIDGKNSERLAAILSKLNFADLSGLEKLIANQESTIQKLQNELTRLQSIGQRRSNPRAPKPAKQPVLSNSKQRGARSRSPKVQNPSSSAEGTEGNGNDKSNGEAEGKEARQQSTGPA